MTISNFVVDYFLARDKEQILNNENILSFNYIDNHFFSSIEFIEMISDIEQNFDIAFEDEQMRSHDFSTVGGLIGILNNLYKGK